MVGARTRALRDAQGLTKRDRFWLGHLRVIARGREPATEYTRRKGLSVGALYEAKRRLERRAVSKRAVPRREPRGGGKPVSFARVALRSEPALHRGSVRLRLAGGVELECSSLPELDWLVDLVERLAKRA